MTEFAARPDSLKQAQEMAEWFPDYLYGLDTTVRHIPDVLRGRIEQLFGKEAPIEAALMQLRELVLDLGSTPDLQHNAVLYVCGYSDEDMRQFGLGDVTDTVVTIESRFATQSLLEAKCDKPQKTEYDVTPAAVRRLASPALRATVTVPGHTYGREIVSLDDLASDVTEEEWRDRALCAQVDPEIFFPEKGGSTREAKKVCAACEVKDECLEDAMHHDERFGIRGGLSERERRRLKKGVA